MGPTILFRCDASDDVGLGHLSRCLALAEALEELGAITMFAGRAGASGERLLGTGRRFIESSRWDGDGVLELFIQSRAHALVLDSYVVDERLLDRLAGAAVKTILFDDYGRLTHYPVTVVINFTVRGPALEYRGSAASLLLGPSFLPVRRAVRQARAGHPSVTRRAARVLLSFGGADPGETALLALETLAEADCSLAVHLVSGRAVSDEIHHALARFADGRVSIGTPHLGEVFAWADTSVVGGGLVKYESCFVGLPTGVLSRLDGEAEDTAVFVRPGIALDLGRPKRARRAEIVSGLRPLLHDPATREGLATCARASFGDDPTAHAAATILERLGAPNHS